MPEFVPGRDLARAFYDEVVAPLVGDTRHSAALLGYGSDVIGFDTPRSVDHGWGPRLQLFVATDDVGFVATAVEGGLPEAFRGWPVRYGWDDVPVSHHIKVTSVGSWLERQLGFDPRVSLTVLDWLTTPQQLLLEVTRGVVFHDGTGELEPLRHELAWYPDDVWLWLLGCQWWRIDQEEPFFGRAAEVGDELGSRVIAARLVRDAMRLCFLFERRYAPYSKWLGSAFRELALSRLVGRPLSLVLEAPDRETREAAWVEVVEALARRHNELGLTAPLDPRVRLFHDRPFRVLDAGRFARACFDGVADERLRSLPRVGGVDQLADSTDLLAHAEVARRLGGFYAAR